MSMGGPQRALSHGGGSAGEIRDACGDSTTERCHGTNVGTALRLVRVHTVGHEPVPERRMVPLDVQRSVDEVRISSIPVRQGSSLPCVEGFLEPVTQDRRSMLGDAIAHLPCPMVTTMHAACTTSSAQTCGNCWPGPEET